MTYIQRRLSYVDADGKASEVDEATLASWCEPTIILGEPGMGKTELLRALAERESGFVYVTAKALLRVQEPYPDGQVVVIDGLDELPAIQEHDPIVDVLTKLMALGRPAFFLSCRAADWRSVALHEIRSDYGHTPVELTLSPLSQSDAIAYLAVKHGSTQAKVMVEALSERGLDEFYGNPLTLELIGRLADRPEGLPNSRAELFRLASDNLRAEQNPHRPRSKLASLSSEAALDAAGAACAALLLTGSEAIGVGAQGALSPGDIHISEIAALPGGARIEVLVSSILFRRRDGVDRVAPFHRALAEYLGARWLARRVADSSAKRLLALITFQGGVPASLRGLHAWLAHFDARLASIVIATDPYGVLRYGDAVHLTPTAAREMLTALEHLSQIDPWFRAEDWTRHTAPGLTQVTMTGELRRVLTSPASNFHLKSLILAALSKSDAATRLAPDLETLLWTPQPPRPASPRHQTDGNESGSMEVDEDEAIDPEEDERFPTFHERSAAFDILAELSPNRDWSDLVETFSQRPGEDDRRLAVEALETIGCERFDVKLIARAALAFLGLLPGADAHYRFVDTIGPLHLLSYRIDDRQVVGVLDALAVLSPATKAISWECRYQYTGFVDHLIARALALGAPIRPLQLLNWLRLVHDRHGHELEDRQAIYRRLVDDTTLRRAIQHHLIFIEQRTQPLEDRVWRLADEHHGLVLQLGDIEALLTAPELRLDEPEMRALWRRLVAHGRTQQGLPPSLRALTDGQAQGDAELVEFLVTIDRKHIPDWQRREKIRRWRANAVRRRRHEKDRQDQLAHVDEILAGDWRRLFNPARAYLDHFQDLARKTAPQERLKAWLGEPLADRVLDGFKALLVRQDVSSASEIAEVYGSRRRPNIIFPLLAGALARLANGDNFDDLPEDVVVAIAIGEIQEHISEDAGGKTLKAALDSWFKTRPSAFEQFTRLLLEPQLRTVRDHIMGLHAVLHNKPAGDLVTRLAVEWLQRFDDIAPSAEIELLDHLCKQGEWSSLRLLLADREARGYRDQEHRFLWRAVAFFADFAAYQAVLDAEAQAHPDFFWTLKSRNWPEDETGKAPTLSLEQLTWVVRTFRPLYEKRHRPMGPHGGGHNGWDASEFLEWVIRRIATKTNDAAVLALAALRDERDDGYRPFIQNAAAQQLKARREAGFTPPSLAQVATVLAKQGPTSVADLQAIVLDALERVQSRMNRDDADQASMFYDAGKPKNEEACRDSLVILLRESVGSGIDTVPERLMPKGKRADIVFACHDLRLPIEAKGQWHKDLWTAAIDQLDAFYTIEWRARGIGIYVVFWFGSDVPASKKLSPPGRGKTRPDTAKALEADLIQRLPEHRRGEIAIVVLDVSHTLTPVLERA